MEKENFNNDADKEEDFTMNPEERKVFYLFYFFLKK